jgi:uncharacterized protein YndB with AHSA1/START domain
MHDPVTFWPIDISGGPKMLKTLGIIAAVLVVLLSGLLIYASTRPDTFTVQRSVSIKAPPEKIFPLISSLRGFNSWEPFSKKDPAIKLVYGGPDSGKGAKYEWQGNRQVGSGKVEITDIAPPLSVAMKLDMMTPMEAHNTVQFTLEPKGETTTVTWAMRGPSPLVAKVMDVTFGMDRMVGSEFEAGLANLKALAEK